MASRILGMGDVMSLIEKTQQSIDVNEAAALEKKVRSQSFDMQDFLGEIQRIKKMGPLDDMLKMIPGASRMMPQGAQVDPKHMKRVEAIIYSMTPEERARPHLMDGSRRKRIAKGSGTTVQDVNALLKQFEEMKKMMKMVGNLQKRKKGRRLGF